ncbi:hypothetical protein BVI434_700018 [Burkholderia vietnamiensis]|nr:hypothetical protein BVI1335_1240019 [Burkholderia vietnamiensis]CAG9230669.1 hypothetical protein BVI434_700018 [Burkholderia vietnamiensis]
MAAASAAPPRGDFPPASSGAFAPCDPTGVSAASGLAIPSADSARARRARGDVSDIAALRSIRSASSSLFLYARLS